LIDELPGAEPLYTSPPHQVPGSFDLITMIHVLEHIVDPVPFLTALLEKLNPGGMLLVEVPNHLQNPVELLTVDHCTHFSPTSLSHVVEQSGYQTTVVATDWVPKEITLVARKADVPVCATPSSASAPSRLVISAAEPVAARLRWLGSVVSTARELARKPSFGLFGTSIAATWLFGELQGQVQFFVDEDPQRIGKQWLERRIYHPAQIPAGSRVFVALPSPLAEVICQRIARPGVAFDLPPRLELP
jgi:SAM-dependent methyltransferase